MPVKSACDSVWYQYAWQDDDKVSRYEIAQTIYQVEAEIAQQLGYWPAPIWIAQERHQYPKSYRKEYYGIGANIRGQAKSIQARWGRIISGGRRALTLIGTATTADGSLTFSDLDGDGLYETATISLVSTLTNASELHAYHTGHNGEMEWEIRNPRSKSAAGGAVTLVFDSWLLLDPEIYEVLPTDDFYRATDISTTANFVTLVDVYREYTDNTAISSTFYWENVDVACATCGGVGCSSCGAITQNGCLRIRDAELGDMALLPSTYDAVNGWVTQPWEGGREPDYVDLWYYAGDRSNEYKAARTSDWLPHDVAMAIAHMAVARMERPFCECGNIREFVDYQRLDLARNLRDTGSWFLTKDVQNSPFGTRIGEVKAWQFVSKTKDKISHVAVI
jgi:hypothetical protein